MFTKCLNLDRCLEKNEIQKTFKIHTLLCTGFLLIPITTLYDENIDRPKLTEQKNPFEYIVPPPH